MDQKLTKLGLTDTESKIYLAILELGPNVAANIAKRANIKRTTTYSVLERLIKEGLVSEVADSKEKMFKAEDPDRLTKLTRKMRRKVIEAEIQLETLLPGLKAIQKKIIEAPKLSLYQGLEGLKIIAEEVTSYPESWYYFGSMDGWVKAWPSQDFEQLTHDTREYRKKVGRPMCFFITDEGYYKIKIFQNYEPNIRQAKILSKLADFRSGLLIYGKKLAIMHISETPFAAVVESAEVVELVKMMFQFIWQSLPEEKPGKQVEKVVK